MLLGAATAFITGVGGISIQLIVLNRQNKLIASTKELHESVNGQSEAFKQLIGKEAFGAGEKAGMEAERDRPVR